MLKPVIPGDQWELGSWLQDGFVDRQGNIIVPQNARAAVAWYRRSANLGHPAAQNSLGVCLSDGKGTRRDDREALAWLKRALRQGDGCAANNIASVYRDRRDSRRALYWYERAAEGGDSDALVEVGARYYAGVGATRNPAYAVNCFRQAIQSRKVNISQAGRESAMYHLGIACYEGNGVRQSNSLALKWLIEANKDDDFPAARAAIDLITGKK
jgi:uncharacterized protein